MGKVAVSFKDPGGAVKILRERHSTRLHPGKAYLMIGCLGGLGRSLTKWMVTRGARKFIFLGQSGSAKPAAQRLVDELIADGADVVVIKGDVSEPNDVEKAVAAIPIGGVFQAAMGLSEVLWATLSNGSWHASIQLKIQGVRNLHNALRQEGRNAEPDSPPITSSICGTAGTATESNYCAANAFQDAYARYWNWMNLPAVSLVGLKQQRELRFEGDDHVLLDPRAGLFATVFKRSIADLDTKSNLATRNQFLTEIINALNSKAADSLLDAVKKLMSKKVSNLILVARGKLSLERRLGGFGLDSMVASEFRNFVYNSLEADVPFMALLDKDTTVGDIALLIAKGVGDESGRGLGCCQH
ncbi:KR-domain-containing protein [Lentithecium fluviatile CBS 122367]|uniref:KR-domain-containing protein n=1 Tax=Lentithecium fluviatile CBS 122367 TaxID=1168545 RepID=A0A6G1IN02_9PLEO|nr:KR-domain-containing protein [Lentithecium fluviatile CBS 122367]